jgi:uncharacterized protein
MSIRKRNIFGLVVLAIVVLNIVAFFHAYKFTHFSDDNKTRTDPKELTFFGKLGTLAFGVDNPRPINTNKPARPFRTLVIPHKNDTIECWYVPVESSKGTVLIFHGYAGNKSQMVKESNQFNELGYGTLLADFLGSGGSTGNNTTIGFYESDQVKTVFDFVKANNRERIIMFGTSMGAVAIMKSINDYQLDPESIILECPFGDMLETVQARFRIMNAPVFPMSHLLTFWGGFQNNFNAFAHNPSEYAEKIEVRTLLLYGMRDDRVSLKETELIFKNLAGAKELKLYPEAGHESILMKYECEWIEDVGDFVENGFSKPKD